MPEWLIILLVFFLVSRLLRTRSDWGRHPRLRSHRHPRSRRELHSPPEHRSQAIAKPQVSPMEALQRRYVDGEITVEEYERELDRLIRSAPRSAD